MQQEVKFIVLYRFDYRQAFLAQHLTACTLRKSTMSRWSYSLTTAGDLYILFASLKLGNTMVKEGLVGELPIIFVQLRMNFKVVR